MHSWRSSHNLHCYSLCMTCTPSSACVCAFVWLLSEHAVTCSPQSLSTKLIVLIYVIGMISTVCWISNEIFRCFSEFCIISNHFFLFPFPQKRAKKLEGETIYIRHSNIMLEVCIFAYLLCHHILVPAFIFS